VHRWAVGSGSCLGVLAVVPGGRSLDHRSDPADWAPSVTLPGASRTAGAGCLWRFRRSSVVATRRAGATVAAD